ncbi:MAG: flavin reductase family protein [Clostridia bacterium]|nr:flavin reductase family protein [Clostridia bacterium]
MAKVFWKPGALLCPVPVVLVTCGTVKEANAVTVAWTGIVNSEPPMTYISLRPSRFSHEIISKTGEFTINLVSEGMLRKTDSCGVYTGRKVNKIKTFSLTPEKGQVIAAPTLKESPLSLECRVTEIKPLGSHDLFLAQIVSVDVEEKFVDENGKLDLRQADLVAYSHGDYLKLGRKLGSFGYSVKKTRPPQKKKD